jgi:hypothetical protein
VRVVDLGDGRFEQRAAVLDERAHPWIWAAQRHLAWLESRE